MSEQVDPQLQVAAPEHVANDVTEAPTTAVEVAANTQEDNTSASAAPKFASQEEVMAHLKTLLESPETADRTVLEACKSNFYRFHNEIIAKARQQFVAEGHEEADFVAPKLPLEEEFKQLLADIKVRRAEIAAKAEAERQANLARKLEIIEKLKELAADAELIDKNYDTFKALQTEWKELGAIPAERVTDTWKSFQHAVEQGYDLLRINHEMREYDFKKNLEIKTRLCEAAEQLTTSDNVIDAFHQLQQLHAEYRETGPVAKELRDEVWSRFKTASTTINKRHQDFFIAQKQQEEENLQRKTEICERVEAIDLAPLRTMNDWETVAQQIIAMQAEWKTIGSVPNKASDTVWKRFSKACNTFFDRKKAANNSGSEEETANLAKKQDIIARLQQLIAEGSDNLHDAVKALQAEWNEVGHVPFKKKEQIYQAYRKACDTLYETLHEEAGRRRIDNMVRRATSQGGNERQRLQRALDEKKAEIANYETNLSFLTAKSKSGSSLVADVERRIELLKKDLVLLTEKIAQLGE